MAACTDRTERVFILAMAVLLSAGTVLPAPPDKPVFPLTLRDGIPRELPGYAAQPSDSLPETEENEMGTYTEVARFFQRIESPTSAKQFRIAVQDYAGKEVVPAIRRAFEAAGRTQGVEAKETKVAGRSALAVTDRTGPRPTTLITVVLTPSRLVLGQGANVERDEALKLLAKVDFDRIASAR